MGSIFDVASSRQTIYLFYKIIRRKLITYFSPFDKLLPDFAIIKFKLESVIFISFALLFYSIIPLILNPV